MVILILPLLVSILSQLVFELFSSCSYCFSDLNIDYEVDLSHKRPHKPQNQFVPLPKKKPHHRNKPFIFGPIPTERTKFVSAETIDQILEKGGKNPKPRHRQLKHKKHYEKPTPRPDIPASKPHIPKIPMTFGAISSERSKVVLSKTINKIFKKNQKIFSH